MGWHHVGFGDGRSAMFKTEERDGHYPVVGVYIQADEVTSEVLRSLPIGRLAATYEEHGRLKALTESLGVGSGYEEIESEADAVLTWMHNMTKRMQKAQASHKEKRPRLTRPGDRSPDEFYQLVATAYREFAVETRAASARIAEEADVPVSTGHRWVREARRRGFLPAGQRGKTQ